MLSGVPRVAAGGERRPGASGGAWPADASAAPRGRPSRGCRPRLLPSHCPLCCPLCPAQDLGVSWGALPRPARSLPLASQPRQLCVPTAGRGSRRVQGPPRVTRRAPWAAHRAATAPEPAPWAAPPFHVLVLAPAPHPAWTQGPRPVSVDIAPQPQALAPLLLASFLFLLVLVTWGNSFLVSSTVR